MTTRSIALSITMLIVGLLGVASASARVATSEARGGAGTHVIAPQSSCERASAPWIAIGFLALAAMIDAHRTRTDRTKATQPLPTIEPVLGP